MNLLHLTRTRTAVEDPLVARGHALVRARAYASVPEEVIAKMSRRDAVHYRIQRARALIELMEARSK